MVEIWEQRQPLRFYALIITPLGCLVGLASMYTTPLLRWGVSCVCLRCTLTITPLGCLVCVPSMYTHHYSAGVSRVRTFDLYSHHYFLWGCGVFISVVYTVILVVYVLMYCSSELDLVYGSE